MQNTKLRFKDQSTMSKNEYIFFHILYSAMFGYDTYAILPAVVPLTRYNSSIPRLIICILVTNLFGLLFSFRHNRRGIGVAADVVAGMGVYTILTAGKYMPVFTKYLLVGLAGFSVVEILFVICRKIKNKHHIRPVMTSRFLKCTQVVRRNTALTGVIVLIAFSIEFKYLQTSQMDETYQKEASENFQDNLNIDEIYGDEYQLSNNIDIIKYIRDNDEFQTLSYDEKCNVIRALIFCEARYLGLCELHIEFIDMRDSLLGSYEHATKTIAINAKTLRDGSMSGGSAEELLITALHECRHCYQHLLGELFQNASPSQRNLYVFTNEDVAEWVTNLENYKTSDGTVDGESEYRLQVVEWDANNYAIKEANVYYLAIDKLLSENMQEE